MASQAWRQKRRRAWSAIHAVQGLLHEASNSVVHDGMWMQETDRRSAIKALRRVKKAQAGLLVAQRELEAITMPGLSPCPNCGAGVCRACGKIEPPPPPEPPDEEPRACECFRCAGVPAEVVVTPKPQAPACAHEE